MRLETKTIATKRLILRQFTVEDAEAMYRNWAADSESVRFMTFPPYQCVEDVAAFLGHTVEHYEKEDACGWAITRKDTGEVMGSLGANVTHEETRCIKVGYIIGKRWWHQGITSEALSAVISYLFENSDVNRIEAQHDIRNPHSGGVMKKCGMQYEGTMRQSARNNVGIADMAWYSILRSDYERNKP